MIEWFSWVTAGVAALAGLLGFVLGFAGRKPGDVVVGALAIVELLLIAQVVLAIVGPLAGNPPEGDVIEFWAYLVTAVIIPPAAVLWSLVERNKWSTVILGVAAFAVAVMVVRMQQIWSGQGPIIGA